MSSTKKAAQYSHRMLSVALAGWLMTAQSPLFSAQAGREQSEFFEFLNEEEVTVTAAKREQPAKEAPAIVTVITAEEIRNRGYLTLEEVLRDVVGFEVNDNLHWPDTGVRGINPTTGEIMDMVNCA